MIEHAISALNDAFKRDPAAMHALLCNRVPCNIALMEHPTVQVGGMPPIEGITEETYNVGALGLINGVVEAMTGRRVAALYSDKDESGRCKLLGFCEWNAPVDSASLPALMEKVTGVGNC